ncbi:hypothetical protein HPP92_012394 [Vanilla planifolia]|uniref:Uncharacterized protein n=1 Tax=Vanilla planifolia TaxID=51239 RepID=A0A835QWV6_VANPL|nr:hypothetical protein HPP92_012394 [Vanilla planifolia]
MVGTRIDGKNKSNLSNERQYSELDLLSLLKFDLEVLSSTTSVDCPSNSEVSADCVTLAERSARVTSFILNKFVPFEFPIEGFCELQVHAIRTLCKLSEVEFLVQLDDCAKLLNKASVVMDSNDHPVLRGINKQRFLANEYLRKFSGSMARALTVSLPLGTKLEGLGWIRTFTLMVLSIKKGEQLMGAFSGPYQDVKISDVLFFSILDAAFDGEVKVRYQVASVLELLLQAGLIHPENFCFISEVVFNRLTDPETSIKISFVRLLSISVPLTLYINGITDDCYFWKLKTTSYAYPCYLNWKKALALKKMHRKLHSQQFLSVFSYLSQRLKAPLSYWIRRLVFSCHDRKDRANQQELIGGFDYMDVCKDSREEEFVHEKIYPINNLAAIWWSIHEAARYCIDIRLRTTLGGPTQTFASLERMLCDIPNMLQVDFEPNNDQYWSLSNFHLLPVRLLLDFVECLKKNVYNAYDGSSILPSPTGQSSLFFRTNKKVCEEWFFRICEPMLNAGMALNYHDATFYYCASRLQDLRNPVALAFRDKSQGATENFHNLRNRFAGDIMKILQRASLALCKIHEPEALIGLQRCVGQMFPSLFMDNNHTTSSDTGTNLYFSWMTGLVYQARGQYEKAAAHFSHLLQTDEALGSMGSDGIQFIIARVIESYASLSDWKSLESWLSELQALRSVHAGKAYSGALTASGNEINAIHALACFDEGEVQSAWTYLDLTPKHSCQLTLDPTVAFERSEQMLLRSMLQRETNSTDDVLKDLEKAKVMLDEALSIIPLDGLNEAAACATHLHCIFVLEECLTSSAQHLPSVLTSLSQLLNLPISTIHQDSSLWIKIFRIYHTLKPTSVETMLLGQRLLSLARKQTNFMLAERLIQNLKSILCLLKTFWFSGYKSTI